MTRPTNDEKAMAGRLDAVIEQIGQERALLRLSRLGDCACSGNGRGDGLCALHVDVYNLLGEAAQKLAYAADRLEFET